MADAGDIAMADAQRKSKTHTDPHRVAAIKAMSAIQKAVENIDIFCRNSKRALKRRFPEMRAATTPPPSTAAAAAETSSNILVEVSDSDATTLSPSSTTAAAAETSTNILVEVSDDESLISEDDDSVATAAITSFKTDAKWPNKLVTLWIHAHTKKAKHESRWYGPSNKLFSYCFPSFDFYVAPQSPPKKLER
ncbi:hypothetical protein D9611_005245 [Ephemerocybe angulata]|uniref:Uncharacterized protein n=1 Tax=Ephemerocybe angulata TaxID=980116 RepID=A0A8H5BZU1_9AGAR|nr:hypothetical protein D9611_005245 [Tulosesus angulatus]